MSSEASGKLRIRNKMRGEDQVRRQVEHEWPGNFPPQLAAKRLHEHEAETDGDDAGRESTRSVRSSMATESNRVLPDRYTRRASPY